MVLPSRVLDLTEAHVAAALASPDAMRALLEHLARIARPGEGAAKIFVPLARMATTACDFVDDDLAVELTAAGGETQLVVATDLGGGMRELLFPRITLGVPIDELADAIALAPQLVYPLRATVGDGKIRLTCEAELVRSLAPPAFEIAEECLRRSLSPELRASLPPVAVKPEDLASLRPVVTVGAIGRIALKAPRAPKLAELAPLDVGWDVTGVYSSTVSTRETKPPPEPMTLSNAPTKPPPRQ